MREPDFYSLFIAPLETADFVYMVTGSIAATFYGEPRLTHDIDLVLHLDEDQVQNFIKHFPAPDYYCPPVEVIRIEMVRDMGGHFNLIHSGTGLKADCYPLTGEELDDWGVKNRQRIQLNDTETLWLAPVEYVMVRKLEYFRMGGAQKHLRDIEKIVRISSDLIDYALLDRFILKRELQSVWAKIPHD